MKATGLAIALLMGSAAFAQTATQNDMTTGPSSPINSSTMNTDTNPQTNSTTTMDADRQVNSTGMNTTAQTGTNVDAHSGHQMNTHNSNATMNNQAGMNSQSGMAQPGMAQPGMTTAGYAPSMPGRVVMPGNGNPEEDARGIAVISAPAVVPVGWNGVTGAAVGGPLADPNTGEALAEADQNYPPCTATRTDNCVQAYTRR